jgi:hypothetical protein
LVSLVEGIAQIGRQLAGHLLGDLGALADLRDQRVEGVEEKVRGDLDVQAFDLEPERAGLGGERLHPLRTRLDLRPDAQEGERPGGDDAHVIHEADRELAALDRQPVERSQAGAQPVGDEGHGQGDADAPGGGDGQAANTPARLEPCERLVRHQARQQEAEAVDHERADDGDGNALEDEQPDAEAENGQERPADALRLPEFAFEGTLRRGFGQPGAGLEP